MSNNLIYIELTNNYLFLSKLKNKKNRYLITNSKTTQLTNLETNNEALFNLSAIYTHIKNFLSLNNLKKPTTIFCSPTLNQQKENNQKLNTLQIALCLNKAGLKIQKIIGQSILLKGEQMRFLNFFYKKDIDKQLNFFNSQKTKPSKSPFKWLLLSSIAFFYLLMILTSVHSDKKIKLNQLQSQNLEISKQNKILEEKSKELHNTIKANNKIKEKIEKIQRTKTQTNNPVNTLFFIADHMPKNSWLTNINIPQSNNIELEGITKNEIEVTKFIKNLSLSPELKNIKLIKIKKGLNKKKKNPLYKFKISAQCKIQTLDKKSV